MELYQLCATTYFALSHFDFFCTLALQDGRNLPLLKIAQNMKIIIQSTLVISKSKGPSEKLRDIRTSTYQFCRIEANTHQTTKFHNEHVI